MRAQNLRSGLAQLEVFHVPHLVDHFVRILTEWIAYLVLHQICL